MRIRSVPVFIAMLVVASLTACGNDEADLGPYVDAAAANFAETPDDDSVPLSDVQARCAAEHAVDAIDEDIITGFGTPEEFAAATKENLAPLNLDDSTLDTIADDFAACFGGLQFLLDFLTEFGVSDEQVDCVRENISEDDVVGSIRADIAGETNEEFDTEIGACLGE